MHDLITTIRVQAQVITGLTGDLSTVQEALGKAQAELRALRQAEAERDAPKPEGITPAKTEG